MIRLFVALDLAIPVVERLVLLQDELDRRLPKEAIARLVAPEHIHVTLKFIGEVDVSLVPVIEIAIAEMTRPLFPFEFRTQGCGAFPDVNSARIVWAGLDAQGAEVMSLLNQTLERGLDEIGIIPDAREYRPHITLARIRSEDPVDVSAFLAPLKDLEFGTSYVRDLVLISSELTKDGPVYKVVRRFALGED